MGLTYESEQRMKDAGLVRLYTQDKAHWQGFVKHAYTFVKSNFPQAATIRHDDVAKALFPVVEVDELLTEYCQSHKLRQKFWKRDFCDLIIERCWSSVSK